MLYSIFQKLFYKIRQEAVLSIAVLSRPALCLLRFAGRILFRLYRFSHAYHPVFPNDCHGRAAASGRFYTVRIFLLSRTNSITSPGIRPGRFMLFFCSMLITNDVALLTFVPFSFAVLGQLPEASGKNS